MSAEAPGSYDRRWMNRENKFFDNTLIRKVCDCSFNTSFGFLYVEKKFKWGKVAKLAQSGLSMKSESETAIYLRCKNGGQKGAVSMKVCKDAPKVENVGSSQRLFPEEPNPDDSKFCTLDKKLIPIGTVMRNLVNPKTGIVKKANVEHEKIKKLAIGPKNKGFSVLDCLSKLEHTDSNPAENNTIYLLDGDDPLSWNDKILKKKSLLHSCKLPKKERPEFCFDKNYPIDAKISKCTIVDGAKQYKIGKAPARKTKNFLNKMYNQFIKNPFYCF